MDKQFNPENMNRFDSEKRRKLIPPKMVLDLINIEEGNTFLDIGAGTGYFTLPALQYVGNKGKVIAVDISEEMLEELKRRLTDNKNNIDIILCDAKKVPLSDKIADKILMAFVFHEIEDKKQYLIEIGRLIKENGEIVIVEWDKVESPMGPPLAERISYQELLTVIEVSGYSAIKYKKINDYHYLSILKKK